MLLNCYVDEDTLRHLRMASEETGRKVDELAEAAIANAALEYVASRGHHFPSQQDSKT